MAQRRTMRLVSRNYSTYASVSSMISSLWWRSLEDRRADARMSLFIKVVYLVAVPVPQYINLPYRMTRHIHPLPFCSVANKYSQTCLKGSPNGRAKNWLLQTGDPLIQVHLYCILLQGTQKRWLLKARDPLIEVTT